MATQRVYVIWTHPLFRESARLLLNHPDVEWLGATSSFATAQDEIPSLLPDTILVEETSGDLSSEVLEILEHSPGNVRMISLSLTDNRLSIYNHEQREVGQSDDLLRSILRDPS
jgi:hypothetical protein